MVLVSRLDRLPTKEFSEVITAHGHKNIQATHETTLEITKDHELSRRGTCIIAVSADKSMADLNHELKAATQADNSRITILIQAGNASDIVHAYGSSKLVLTHPTDMVIRKSNFFCERTLAVRADKAACDLSRELAEKLKDPRQKVKVTLTVKP